MERGLPLLERVEEREGRLAMRGRDVFLDELRGELEGGGQSLAAVAERHGLEAAEVLAGLAALALGLGGEGLALVRGKSKHPALARHLGEESLAGLLPGSSRVARLCLSAGLLQVFDNWDRSHTAAQQADDLGDRSLSAYWHGIAHRREPDAGNASYWFRRVGRHELFEPLGNAAAVLIEESADAGGAAHFSRVIQRGAWDPYAFIEACGRVKLGSAEEALGRRLQRMEMVMLLDSTARAAGVF